MIKLPLIILFLINLLFFSSSPASDKQMDSIESINPLETLNDDDDLEKFAVNKVIPEEIRKIALIALSHFPELMDVDIDFQFQKKIRGSVMQAQPKIGSLIFKKKEKRAYRIKVSRYLELHDEFLPIEDLPDDVLLGWLGHELGHIKDYISRSMANMVSFGVKYSLSKSFLTAAEVQADSYTVSNGLAEEIIATKNFVLNHDRLPESYKDKIRALYMSPGEVLTLVDVEEEDEEN